MSKDPHLQDQVEASLSLNNLKQLADVMVGELLHGSDLCGDSRQLRLKVEAINIKLFTTFILVSTGLDYVYCNSLK